jgi:hypothetical protein
MEEKCPFCVTPINEGASVCAACGAMKTKEPPSWVIALWALDLLLAIVAVPFAFAMGGFAVGVVAAVVIIGPMLLLAASTTRFVWKRQQG